MSVIGNIQVVFTHAWDRIRTTERATTAIYLEVNFLRNNLSNWSEQSNWTTLSTNEARDLARELVALADQYDRDAEENSKPKLPTEPGIYVVPAANHVGPDALHAYTLLILDDMGNWTVGNSSTAGDAEVYARKLVDTWGSLVRLYAEKP